jgi:hypothetical protein
MAAVAREPNTRPVAAQSARRSFGFLEPAMALAPNIDFVAAAWPIDVIDMTRDGISENGDSDTFRWSLSCLSRPWSTAAPRSSVARQSPGKGRSAPRGRMPQACDQCTHQQFIETGVSTVSPGEVQALRGSGWMLTVSACPRLGCKSNSGSTPPSRSGPRPGHHYRRKSGTGDPVDDPPHADRRPGTSLAACDTLGAGTACARAQFECYREDP